jgi:hypothetical protein
MHKSRVIFILVGLILVAFLGTAYAGHFGAPQPIAPENRGSLGIGYFFHQNTWQSKDGNSERDIEQNQIYVQFSAATKYVEGYLRIGGADLKIDDVPASGNTFKDDGRVFGTVGARAIIELTPYFGIGPFFQASLYDNFKDSSSGQPIEFNNPGEIAGGLAFQGKIGRFIVYAGPYLYWLYTKDELTDTSFESKSNFGGMAGIRITIDKGFSIEAECQYLDKVSAGVQLSYSF